VDVPLEVLVKGKVRISGHNLNISVMCTVHPGKLRWLGGKSAYYPIFHYILIGNTLTYIGCFFHCNGRYLEGHWRTIDWTLNMLQHRCCFRFPLLSLRTCLKIEVSNLQKKKQVPPCLTPSHLFQPIFFVPLKSSQTPKRKGSSSFAIIFQGRAVKLREGKKNKH